MTLSAGSILNDENGSPYRLSREIARWAEGAVWAIDGSGDRLAKVYLRGMNDHHVAKVSAMCRIRTDALSSVGFVEIDECRHALRTRSCMYVGDLATTAG
jgi:DNA-binding helix-hairpin-helix protein with protein kinase domain